MVKRGVGLFIHIQEGSVCKNNLYEKDNSAKLGAQKDLLGDK